MSKARLTPSPICLVENMNGSLSTCKDAIEFLCRIHEPVVVVSLVELYHTGKSFLMNRLAGQQSAFALGNTIESKTKGIWMWCVPHPYKEGHTLVLLDTEGLGNMAKTNNDGWIFCLAVLLSSTLVYNSRGTIDNTAVENLHYVTELAENIKIRSKEVADDEEEDEDCKFLQFFPSLTWVVRDINLELVIEGKRVTEDEYLEFALQLKKVVSKKVSDYNLPRQCIRNYFTSFRKCFVFPSPASPGNMTRLESLQERDLVPDFLEVTGRFCDHIFHNSVVKTVKGQHIVTGKLLGHLVKIYVDTINSVKVPCLNQTAVQEAYQIGMEKVKYRSPLDVDDIISEHQKLSSLATSEFMKRSFKDEKGEYLKKLKEDIEMYYVGLLEHKYKEEEKKCMERVRMLQAEKERHQDQMRQIQEKLNKKMEQQKQEMDRAIESKMKEWEEMLKKGFSEKADLLNEEIANLKKEKESSSGIMKDYVIPILGVVAEILPAILNYKVLMK